jgi:FixJ family two-component response regulator
MPAFDSKHDFCEDRGRWQDMALSMPPKMNEGVVVHVVDDDLGLRDALKDLFHTIGLTVRTYGTAGDFLKAHLTDAPGCIVIDIRLPDTNGLAFQTQLADAGIRLPVVMMTGYGDIAMTVRAMKGGAVDFLAKPFRDQDMLDAVLTAIERDRQQRVAEHSISDIQQRFATLSTRQKQVMNLVTAGKLNKQVAAALGISEITAKIHRGVVMRKMAAHTLADLVRMADALAHKGTYKPV